MPSLISGWDIGALALGDPVWLGLLGTLLAFAVGITFEYMREREARKDKP